MRWQIISEALKLYKQGIIPNTEALSGDDRDFYKRVIEASKAGVIEL